MIITCNKCSSNFNLDDSLVKKSGSKVRCSVCKNTFTAYPTPLEQEPDELSAFTIESGTDDGDVFEGSTEFEMEDGDFSLKDSELSLENSDFDMDDTTIDSGEPGLEVDDDFSFEGSEFEIDEGSESLDAGSDVDSSEFEDDGIEFEFDSEENFDGIDFEPIQEDEFSSLDKEDSVANFKQDNDEGLRILDDSTDEESLDEDLMADEDEFELEFDVEDDSEDEIASIDNDDKTDEIIGIPPEDETEDEYDDSPLSLEESNDEEDEFAITPEDNFSEYEEVLEQETEPEDDFIDEEIMDFEEPQVEKSSLFEIPGPDMYTPPKSRRKGKKSLVGAPVFVLLLIFFLVAGAYVASLMTGYKIPYLSDFKIPFIEQYLKKSTPAPETSEDKPTPNQKSVNGRFVTNSTAGTLFVITGRVENPSNFALNHIEVQGTLVTKDKVEAKLKNVFCGNIITEEMLKTGNIFDINKLLETREGSHNSNINIKPGTSVPFMVVFSELPEKLQNFTVKVSSFEKAK